MKRYIIRYIILFLLISLQYSYAQWESAGWSNDRYINAMAVCNGTMIRAQNDFIMTSSNFGSTWQKVSGFKANISDFAHSDNSVIVAATYSGGAFLSSDCGLSWELISSGVMSGETIQEIQISGDTIVAGAYFGADIFISTNLGETWELKNSGLPKAGEISIESLVFKNDTIFVCVGANGNFWLYKSSDLGETWKSQGAEAKGALTVFIDKDRVYMYAQGLKISEDMGETWTKVTPGDETVFVINSNADKLYTGTANGVYCSIDGGENWIDYGLKGVSVKSIDFIDDKIIASSLKALYMLESPDEDWQLLDTLINMGEIENYAIKDDLIYAYSKHAGTGAISVSNDYGETWEILNPMTYFLKVTEFEAINDKLFLATNNSDLENGGLQVSTDNGKSWQPHMDLPKYAEEIDSLENSNPNVYSFAEHESYLFMGTSVGILHSSDNGDNWDLRENNIDTVNNAFAYIPAFASMEGELFLRLMPLQSSTDYGETWWRKPRVGIPSAFPSSLFALEETLVASFVAGDYSGVYISKDRALSWDNLVESTLAYNGWATKDVGLVFAFDNYIFANTSTVKANFITADEGMNWVPINEGLPDLKINDIKRVGDYLIVGTSGGFSRAKISDIADIIITAVPEELPLATQESTAYPNPTDSYLYIDKYAGSPLEYEIFDYAGKKVLTGTLYGHEIDASALPAAAYIIVLSDGADTHTMKFIKK